MYTKKVRNYLLPSHSQMLKLLKEMGTSMCSLMCCRDSKLLLSVLSTGNHNGNLKC